MHTDPLGDGISRLALIDSMGNSLSVVNDARQSFDSESTEFTERDGKLLNYLAKHKHTSPFRGVVFKWAVKCPLFVARQWYKHTIASTYVDDQLGWNEKSFRYVSAEEAEFYIPLVFGKQSKDNRQATDGILDATEQELCFEVMQNATLQAHDAYKIMIKHGVSKEQARAILPASLYTSFVWTCSLQALFHFISLRIAKGAQGEIVAYAKALLELGRPVAPEAFEAFESNNYEF